MADSEEKLSRLATEFGRGCERIKLRVNVGKSRVMRWSWYVNVGRMHVRQNGGPVEEVACLKYIGRKWQRMEDVNVMYTELMNGG